MALEKFLNSWYPSKDHFHETNDVSFKHNDESNVDYFLQIIDDTLICIFEPTVNSKDWASDFEYFPEKFDIYPGSNIKVHIGIGKQYLSMRNEFLDLIYNNPQVKKIYISGYSLGGGLAQLACEDAAYHFPNYEIISISYEGPRVFSPHKAVKKLLRKRQFIIKTFWDPVVHVPFKVMPLLPFKLEIKPFKMTFTPKFGISFFQDYGKIIWIGSLLKIKPLQHLSGEIENNLLERFKR